MQVHHFERVEMKGGEVPCPHALRTCIGNGYLQLTPVSAFVPNVGFG
jgi:hypothetical protein